MYVYAILYEMCMLHSLQQQLVLDRSVYELQRVDVSTFAGTHPLLRTSSRGGSKHSDSS